MKGRRMRQFLALAASILAFGLTSWLVASSTWWFVIGFMAGYSIMKDEYRTYTTRSDNLRQKCWEEGISFDAVAALGRRGEFLTGILINGTAIGLLLCFTGRVLRLLFQG